MNDILSVSLKNITPPNLIKDSNIASIADALNPQLLSVSREAKSPLLLHNIDSLPVDVLDALAVQFHCDFYDLAQTPAMKREAVSSSVLWHMKKGTPSAIIQALKALGITATFIPWWEYDGQPYTFKIKAEITGDFYRGAGRDRITRLITRAVNESKSARSLMCNLETILAFSEQSDISAGIIRSLGGNMQIRLNNPDTLPHNVLYSAHCSLQYFHMVIGSDHDRTINVDFYIGAVRFEHFNKTIGVSLQVMYELLEQFEKRIFARLDDIELSFDGKLHCITAVLDKKINDTSLMLDAKIDKVIDMLRWKGDDENG